MTMIFKMSMMTLQRNLTTNNNNNIQMKNLTNELRIKLLGNEINIIMNIYYYLSIYVQCIKL